METQNENERVRGDAWIGKTVLVKGSSPFLSLIPVSTGALTFKCVDDNGTQIKIEIGAYVSDWLPKTDFELYKP